jgi:intracellular sulfur oxidation DsrE/DsrF family protein
MKKNESTSRRNFIGTLAAGATAGMYAIPSPLFGGNAPNEMAEDDPDAWFNKIKGKHRIVFDCTRPHEIFPFAWPRVFLMTNDHTGTPATECGVVVVLRHDAIPYAFEDKLWQAYGFGEMFKADDPLTKAPAIRNPFMKPKTGDFSVPGIGNVAIGINELQESGVMFCVCDAAITVYTAVAAGNLKKDPAEVKKEWLGSLLPGIQVVPSGVWAVGRAQEKGCGYCFAG